MGLAALTAIEQVLSWRARNPWVKGTFRSRRRGAGAHREDSGSLTTLWRGQRSAIPVTPHGLPGLPWFAPVTLALQFL
jgi:hypothetical protein